MKTLFKEIRDIPNDIDPWHLDIEYKHGECPMELKPYIDGSFFIKKCKKGHKPFECNFYTFFDAREMYFYRWDSVTLERASFELADREEEGGIEPKDDDWEVIYKKI